MSTNIKINDFMLFYDIVKALTRMADGVMMSINDCGLSVCAKNPYSKCELTSNAISSSSNVKFCIKDLNMFLKVLNTIKELHKDDYSSVSFSYDDPFLKISSKKLKTKISTVNKEIILDFIGVKVHTSLTPKAKFITNSALIKSINSHSFIFNDTASARIYIKPEVDMANNTVFATIGNENDDLANSITLELGLLNYGSLDGVKAIIDFNRLNVLNMIPSDELTVEFANERPVLMTKIKKTGNNNTFFNIDLYVFLMVK